MASTYLTRTFGSGNRKKFTLSMWVKLSGRGTGNNNALLVCGSSGGNEATISFGSDNLTWTEYQPANGSVAYLSTSKLFRDYSAWYHLVFVWDTANATADDRMKIYVNGVQETSFGGRTNPSLNYEATLNTNIVHNIGRQTWNSSGLFNGCMSHVHFSDGQTLAPTVFGETDTTTGEWKIKTSPSFTLGTNGFSILKDGNTVTDQSSNSNDFTVGGGTLTKTEDNPSNVFATLNPLNLQAVTKPVLQYGNTSVAGSTDGGVMFNGASTLGMTSGKFYCEFKLTSASNNFPIFGITGDPSEQARNNWYIGYYATSYGYYGANGNKYNNNSSTSWGTSWNAQNDIVGCAVDLDNLKIYFHKNGTWQDSGDPTSGSTGTGSPFTLTAPSLVPAGAYFFGTSDGSGTYATVGDFNFGNGYFGTTAVSSAGTNASGIGIFEYDVPTGYTALSTKGLNL